VLLDQGDTGRAKINGKTLDLGRFACFLGVVALGLLAVCGTGEARAQPIEIVALGDSNTAGDGVGRNHAWPALVEAMLRAEGYEVTIRNAGASGDTTGEALARFDRAFPETTDAAIVFLGRNDMRFGAPVARTSGNIEEIVSRLRARGVEVLLIGFQPYDFSTIAIAAGASYYPDFFEGVAKNGKKLRRYILPLDLFHHLNRSGHNVVADNLLPAVRELVKRAGG
jgi:acyl-CoA thioesterase-1